MKTFHTILYLIITFFVSAGIFIAYLSINSFGNSEIGGFSNMLEGTAFRPSIYRLLIPALAKAGTDFIPARVVDLLENAPRETIVVKAFHQLSDGRYFREAIGALILIYISLAGFVVVERALLNDLGYSIEEQHVVPILLAVMALPLSVHFAYVYDLPQVFLFAVCILFLYRRNWTAYLALLTISLLNKETSFFLIIIFAVYYFQKLARREFTILLGAQFAIFVTLRAVIMYIFRNNPGVTIFWSTRYHIDQYTKYPSTLIFTVILFGAILFLMLKDWQRKPIFLRYASSVFPLTLILFFVAGMPMEFRIFLDVLPVFGIMLFPHQKTSQPLEDKVKPVLQHGPPSNP